MPDDWSLEGRQRIAKYLLPDDGTTSGIVVYDADNIENLRQELIEEREQCKGRILHRVLAYLTAPKVIEKPIHIITGDIASIINEEFRNFDNKINKRFGIKER